MTVLEMIKKQLVELGADGLCNPKTTCGCSIEKLGECGCIIDYCKAARKVSCVPGEHGKCKSCDYKGEATDYCFVEMEDVKPEDKYESLISEIYANWKPETRVDVYQINRKPFEAKQYKTHWGAWMHKEAAFTRYVIYVLDNAIKKVLDDNFTMNKLTMEV